MAVAGSRHRWLVGPTDALVLLALALLALAALVSRQRVAAWGLVVIGALGFGLAYAGVVGAVGRMLRPALRAAFRAAAVFGALAYLFSAVAPLQLVIHAHWLDGEVLSLEQALFGVQPTVWLQRIVRPWLTEWMMVAYVAYVALYPLVCGAVWQAGGDRALEHCLLALAAANLICDIGFVAIPVAGPMAFIADRFTVPLAGGPFTALGELIRAHLHYVGGSLPSPHCAAATVLWAMAWRYRRWLALALAPLVLSLYAATVYCRYHYVSDGVAGILVAAVVIALLRRGFPAADRADEGFPPASQRVTSGARR